jgi:hypothetical protein
MNLAEGTTSYNFAVQPALIQPIRNFKFVTRDTSTGNTCEEVIEMNCPTVGDLKSDVDGNSVLLSWKEYKGVTGYRVHITSLKSAPQLHFTRNPSILINDLGENETYSWFVETVCRPGTGPFSDVATFTTEVGSEADGECTVPLFTAESQASDFSNPNTGNPLPFIYYFTQDSAVVPSVLPTNSIQADPEGDFLIPFGNVVGPKYYGVMYLATSAYKTRYLDMNNTNNQGDIGGGGDLFGAQTITIGTNQYRLHMTNYPTDFAGSNEAVRFLNP